MGQKPSDGAERGDRRRRRHLVCAAKPSSGSAGRHVGIPSHVGDPTRAADKRASKRASETQAAAAVGRRGWKHLFSTRPPWLRILPQATTALSLLLLLLSRGTRASCVRLLCLCLRSYLWSGDGCSSSSRDSRRRQSSRIEAGSRGPVCFLATPGCRRQAEQMAVAWRPLLWRLLAIEAAAAGPMAGLCARAPCLCTSAATAVVARACNWKRTGRASRRREACCAFPERNVLLRRLLRAHRIEELVGRRGSSSLSLSSQASKLRLADSSLAVARYSGFQKCECSYLPAGLAL